MKLADLQQNVEDFMEVGDLAHAINLLKLNILRESIHREDLLSIAINYENVLRDFSGSIIAYEDFHQFRARTNKALIDLNNKLQEKDISLERPQASLSIQNEDIIQGEPDEKIILNHILTLSVDKDWEQNLHLFLNPEFFPNATPTSMSDLPTENQQRDIVIFNAMHISEEVRYSRLQGSQKSWFDDLEKLVKTTDHLILYYGPTYDKINEWRYRVASANSPFTLYARLKELANFITIYRR